MVEQNLEAGIYIDAEKSVLSASLLGRAWSQRESLFPWKLTWEILTFFRV